MPGVLQPTPNAMVSPGAGVMGNSVPVGAATPRQWRWAKLPDELIHSTPRAAAASTARARGPVPSNGPPRSELEWLTTGIPFAAIHSTACTNPSISV